MSLIHQVRQSQAVAHAHYKRNYDKLVRPVNKALKFGDWVFVDTHDKEQGKLEEKLAGPYQILKRDANAFSLLVDGYSDHGR